jgi:hypothetical protein
MERHRTLLGALFIALGVSGLIGMAAVALIFFVGSAAIGIAAAEDPSVPGALGVLPLAVGLFICAAVSVSTIPSFVAGYGLLRGRAWARVWSLVAGVLNLPCMPFGTAVAVYAFWVWLQEDRVPREAGAAG